MYERRQQEGDGHKAIEVIDTPARLALVGLTPGDIVSEIGDFATNKVLINFGDTGGNTMSGNHPMFAFRVPHFEGDLTHEFTVTFGDNFTYPANSTAEEIATALAAFLEANVGDYVTIEFETPTKLLLIRKIRSHADFTNISGGDVSSPSPFINIENGYSGRQPGRAYELVDLELGEWALVDPKRSIVVENEADLPILPAQRFFEQIEKFTRGDAIDAQATYTLFGVAQQITYISPGLVNDNLRHQQLKTGTPSLDLRNNNLTIENVDAILAGVASLGASNGVLKLSGTQMGKPTIQTAHQYQVGGQMFMNFGAVNQAAVIAGGVPVSDAVIPIAGGITVVIDPTIDLASSFWGSGTLTMGISDLPDNNQFGAKAAALFTANGYNVANGSGASLTMQVYVDADLPLGMMTPGTYITEYDWLHVNGSPEVPEVINAGLLTLIAAGWHGTYNDSSNNEATF